MFSSVCESSSNCTNNTGPNLIQRFVAATFWSTECQLIAHAYRFQIQDFLSFVKAIYSDLPKHLPKIFEPRAPIRVKDLSELNISELLNETYTTTPIQADKKTADGAVVTVILSKQRCRGN